MRPLSFAKNTLFLNLSILTLELLQEEKRIKKQKENVANRTLKSKSLIFLLIITTSVYSLPLYHISETNSIIITVNYIKKDKQ